jgi:hypothetical protein
MQDSYHFWDAQPTEDLWWAPYVKDFRQLSNFLDPVAGINSKLPANSPQIRWAAVCRAPSINVPQYLLYLQERARSLGAKVIKAVYLQTLGSRKRSLWQRAQLLLTVVLLPIAS